jgi:hypothetical protein
MLEMTIASVSALSDLLHFILCRSEFVRINIMVKITNDYDDKTNGKCSSAPETGPGAIFVTLQ